MAYTYKEGTVDFWIKIDRNPNWLKNKIGCKFLDEPIGDAKIRIIKTPEMQLYIEHYHPESHIRTLSYDLISLDAEKDHHIVLTWSKEEIILYIDGKPVAKNMYKRFEDTLSIKDSFFLANTI
ncbi:LamG domain-containing protein [bacterium]|nr:LamG domain-containing protein [bacterium]